jgi:hypothetical protein
MQTTQSKENTMPTTTLAEARPDELMGLYDEPRARDTLRREDWKDPVALRERLVEIHTNEFVMPDITTLEHRIVKRLKRLTGLDAETIRAYAREDAEMIIATESDAD